MTADDRNQQSLTVSQLNEYVKLLIDGDDVLASVAVCGEISNFKNHYATGHLYFSLKDPVSLVKCVMFSGNASRLKFRPEEGMNVIVFGRVSVFPRDGQYQLYVSQMIPAGRGDQYAAFERLKAKLQAEGLFDQEKKKKLPIFPMKIGVITSPTGAAVRDLLNITGRRFPSAEIVLYPALVQGNGAADSLCRGMRYFQTRKDIDVLIIGRGGGSGEDLGAFNDETLVRLIAAASIPVISAVGHETDFTLSDFAADLRAPTPSAAAELAVPDKIELEKRLKDAEERCRVILSQRLGHYERHLKTLSDAAVLRSPEKYLELKMHDTLWLAGNLDKAFGKITEEARARISALAGQLEALSPLSVLSRGYAAVMKEGHIVTDSSELTYGDEIKVRFRDGSVYASVIGTDADSYENENKECETGGNDV